MSTSHLTRVLILADELGRNAGRFFSVDDYFKYVDLTVTGTVKATFEKVTENIEILARNYTKFDYVIVMAGLNNSRRYREINRNRIDKIIRNLVHTNLIFVGIPFCYSESMVNDVICLNNHYVRVSTSVAPWAFYLDTNPYLYRQYGKTFHLVPMSPNKIVRKIITPIKALLTRSATPKWKY